MGTDAGHSAGAGSWQTPEKQTSPCRTTGKSKVALRQGGERKAFRCLRLQLIPISVKAFQCFNKWYTGMYQLNINQPLLLLLLLSHFSCVRLCMTPWMAAHQSPLSLGFSRHEYWSGLPFPSPMPECMLSYFSRVWPCVTPWTAAHQSPLSLGFSRQEYWSGSPFPSPLECFPFLLVTPTELFS